jgi:GNAT superfamily N-acetyltransferase
VLESLYGEDRGLSLWRSDFLAVHPEYQGRGLGTAIHKVIAAELMKSNEKWVFGTSYYTVSLPGVNF